MMSELVPFGIKFATDKNNYFDTVAIKVSESGFSSPDYLLAQFHKYGLNLRKIDNNHVSVSFDELTTLYDLDNIIDIFATLKKGKRNVHTVAMEDYEGRKYDAVNN